MLNAQQKQEFEIHAERMVHWLRANGHPHMTVVVDSNRAELLEGMMATMPEWRARGEASGSGGTGASAREFNKIMDKAMNPPAPTKADVKEGVRILVGMPQASGQGINTGRPSSAVEHSIEQHPLYSQYWLAIHQAMYGKGVRHGGAVTPFLDQPWIHYARMHGIGFLTGQAAKKLEEAASTKSGDAFINEIRGAMVYLGMALIYHEEVEVKKLSRNMDESRG